MRRAALFDFIRVLIRYESLVGRSAAGNQPLVIGRYALFDVLASGGMATVHLGRLLGREGFGRTVAVKRLHQHFTSDQEFVTMFMDEARIVARIRHPNVVPMVDVLESPQGLFLVMEYVHGESFSRLLRVGRNLQQPIPLKILATIMHGVLLGLHAAHETRGSAGELLDVVHRDVSPQNIIVGADGVARVLDFGVAKAAGRAQVTREGQIKGKLAYMSPEQIRGKVDRRADVFACGVVLWEALVGRRLHEGARDVEIVTRIVQGTFQKPSELRSDVSPDLDTIVMRGLAADPEKRFANARDMAIELERKVGLAPASEVGPWVERLAAEMLKLRSDRIEAMEKAAQHLLPAVSVPPPPPAPPPPPPPHGSGSNVGSYPSDPRMQSAQAWPQTPQALSESSGLTGTPYGAELPMPAPQKSRKDLAPIIAILSFLAALAVIGGILMFVALSRRSSGPVTATSASPSVTVVVPPPSPNVAPETTVPAPKAVLDAGPPAPSASTAPRLPVFGAPWGGVTQPAVPSAKPKKACEPYTFDAQGHKKYNLDCIPNE